jgi:probable rRNA maturation factor
LKLYIVNNKYYSLLDEKIKNNLKRIIKEVKKNHLDSKEKKSLSLKFSSRIEMKKINLKYRNKTNTPDILSFPLNEDYIGDILICFNLAYKNSLKYNHSFNKEICFLFIHGLLHLLGFNHEKKEEEIITFSIKYKILNDLNIK